MCAREMADLIKTHNHEGTVTILNLATGSTPLPVFDAFIRIAHEENIDLSQVISFNLDEYIGLPGEHPSAHKILR